MPMCCCAIDCRHSALKRPFACVFSWYDVITCKR